MTLQNVAIAASARSDEPCAMASPKTIRFSYLIVDPVIRAAFRRAEDEYGRIFALPDEPLPRLDGGAEERPPELEAV